MARIRGRKRVGKQRGHTARRVRIGARDQRLTPCAGVEAVREMDRVLGLTDVLDRHIGRVKQRARGVSGGQLLTAMASCQLTGGDHLVALDRRRADVAGQELEPVATPASTTAAGIAKRFTGAHLGGIEAAIGQVNTTMVALVGQVRASTLLKVATIDGDTTDVEVYGRCKEHAEYSHGGQRNLRPHIGFWAEAGVPLAAELMPGADDPRSNCVDLLDRSIAALPEGVQRIRCRWDAGYFAGALAHACVRREVEFAIGVKRTRPVIVAAGQVPDHQWVPAIGMHDTEVAVIEYLPGSWPTDGVVCIARRTRIPVEKIPTERARKRRTIPGDQLALALEGRLDHVYGYSFILTNLDVDSPEKLAEVEWWYRHRTDIEALNKDAKLGGALRHLPSGDHAVNSVWMWAALLACAISAWIQEITGVDRGNGRGRRTVARLRRDLINVPARLSRRAGITVLRLPPGEQLLATVLPRLQQLPNPG
jgi:hypothetical protein